MRDIIFSACFGLGLGSMLGYQLHEQTTPAADIAKITNSNTAKINELIAWRDKYAKPIVIKPTQEVK